MKTIQLVFPHQLFENTQHFKKENPIYLVEEFLFFKHFHFHKLKIAYHRASMKAHAETLKSQGFSVMYIDSFQQEADIRVLLSNLAKKGLESLTYIDPSDNWLEKRVIQTAQKYSLHLQKVESALFLNSLKDLESYFSPNKKSFFQTNFYKQERKKRNILLDKQSNPLGGKWTFDDENRQKFPKTESIPAIDFPKTNPHITEAIQYVEQHFPNNPGKLSKDFFYPIDAASSEIFFENFLQQRFHNFGIYEDAIVAEASFLNHSVISPMLNVGLLSPQKIIEKSLSFAEKNAIPLNSVEGFVRQIIGWREFIRGVYEAKGSYERQQNFFQHKNKLPRSFYEGTTGIVPFDDSIHKVLDKAYCHHIERLMILGNFMLLCEIDPNEVYTWFMELFIDAYDWVMVPNVYGMSQFADGGLFASKPYIGGSNYILKMSQYKKGDWCATWDALFWRFLHKNRNFFSQNPRLGMLLNTFDKMPEEKRQLLLHNAEMFIQKIQEE